MKPKKYIASCSFGKDSIATILLALENDEPLDGVVFSEVMFDAEGGVSGEMPEHIEWVYGVAIPKLAEMGVKVDVVRSKMDYVDLCKKELKSGKNAGKMYGIQCNFPCYANSYLKIFPIRDYYKRLSKDYDIVQYVGIASDESKRLSRLEGTNKVSLLAKYGYTEAMAMDKCREYGLVSPCYSMGSRGGCWFCYNGGIDRYCHIRKNYPELWEGLKDLYIATASPYLRFNKTFEDVEREMDAREWNDSQPTLF